MANDNQLQVDIVLNPAKAEAQMREFTRTAEDIFAKSEARKVAQMSNTSGFERQLRQAQMEDIRRSNALSALGLKTLDEERERLMRIRAAMEQVTREFATGKRSAEEFLQTTRKLKAMENVQLFGDSRARGEIHRFLAKTASLTFELTGAFYGLAAAVGIVGAGAIFGVKFQKDVEVAQMGMTGIITSMGLIDKSAISVGDSWGIAGVYINKVREDSIKYGVDMSKLTEVNRAVMAPLLSAGIKLPDIQRFATAGSVAVSALGLGAQQFVQEVRDLATAGITAANSTLATSLGVTNTMVKEWKKNGTFIEEMLKRLDGFNKTSEEMLRKTLTGSWEVLKARLGAALQDPEAFQGIIRSVNAVSDAIASPAFKTGVEYYWGAIKGIAKAMMDFIAIAKELTPVLIALAAAWGLLRIIEVGKNAMLAASFVYGRTVTVVTSLTGSTIALTEAELAQAAAARTSAAATTGAAAAATAAATTMTRGAAFVALSRGLGWFGMLLWGAYEVADHFGIVDKYFTSIEDRAKRVQDTMTTIGDKELKNKLIEATRDVSKAEAAVSDERKLGRADKTALAKAEQILADAQKIRDIYYKEWSARDKEEQKFKDMLSKVEGKQGLNGTDGKGGAAGTGHQSRMEVIKKEMEAKITADNKTLTNAERVNVEWAKLDFEHLKDIQKNAEAAHYSGAMQAAQLLDIKEAHDKLIDTLNKEKDAHEKAAMKEPTRLEQIAAENTAREERLKILQAEIDLRNKLTTAPTELEKGITLGRIEDLRMAGDLFADADKPRQTIPLAIRGATGGSSITAATMSMEEILARQNQDLKKFSDAQLKEQADAYMKTMSSAGLETNKIISDDWTKKLKEISDNFKNVFSDAMQPGVSVMNTIVKSFDNAMRQTVTKMINDKLFESMLKPAVDAFSNSIGSMLGAAGADPSKGIGSLFKDVGGMGLGGGALMPQIGAAIAVGSMLKSAFSYGEKQLGERRLVGQVSDQGFVGGFEQSWTQKGGMLASNRSGIIRTDMTIAETNKLNKTLGDLQTTFTTLGSAVGLTNLATKQYTFNINAAGDATNAIADGMGNSLIPALNLFKREGENLADTAKRLTSVFATTTDFISGLGISASSAFDAIGLASTDARQALVDAAGGVDNFSAITASFAQNFLTPAEQMQISLDKVGRTFAELGITGVTTRKQFADLVKAETEAGKYENVAKLLSVADAFAKITDQASKANQELQALLKQDMFRNMVEFQRAQSQAAKGQYYGKTGVSSAAGITTGIGTAPGAVTAPAPGVPAPSVSIPTATTEQQAALDLEYYSNLLTNAEGKLAKANATMADLEAKKSVLPSWANTLFDTQIADVQKLIDKYQAEYDKALKAYNDALNYASLGYTSPLISPVGTPTSMTIAKFADGGVFTNGIFYSPTAFKFANGAGFSSGLMAEAGPEAVMPLKRDSNGVLGVTVSGMNEAIVGAIEALREDLRAIGLPIIQNTRDTAKLITRWEGDGMPEVRTVTS